MINLRKNQIICYDKALAKDKFLIAAKCRFGKTYVAAQLAWSGWKAQIVLVMSGMNVRNEWKEALLLAGFDKVITTNEDLNNFDFKSAKDSSQRVAIFVSTQKAGMGVMELKDPEAINNNALMGKSNIRLIEFFNSYSGTKMVIFDESHFAEQTERSQALLKAYHPNKILYLSATPYTCSIKDKFIEEEVFRFTYKQEMDAYYRHELDYDPVRLNMYIMDLPIAINDQELTENWTGLGSDPIKLRYFAEKLVKDARMLKDKNNLVFCDSVKFAKSLQEALKKIYGVKTLLAAGDSSSVRIDSQQADDFFAKNFQPEYTNFILTCDRLGTGTSIPLLNATVFLCATKSAIKFIQNSMRCCTDYKEGHKEFGNVISYNKFGAYSIYNTIASLEVKDKKTTAVAESAFTAFQKVLPLFIEEDHNLRPVSYIEATNFEEQYVHGKTKFFTDFESLSDFAGFSAVRVSLSKLAKDLGLDKKEVQNAYDKGGIAGVKNLAEEKGIDPSTITEEELDADKSRELLQQAYTNLVESINSYNLIIVNEDKTITIPSSELVNNLVYDNGFDDAELFTSINEQHPEYVRCIKKYCDYQLENIY